MCFLLCSECFDKTVQPVQARFPKTPLPFQPVPGDREGVWTQPAHPHPTRFAGHDDPALLEDTDMFHEARQRHPMTLGEIADARGAPAQLRDDRAARFVGQRMEEAIKISHMAN
jgi:hypothetical protein